ncbi:MAG TPA: DUF1326 domain-containing protein [Gaiellaceae bacterium]|jgi:hypothetical protein
MAQWTLRGTMIVACNCDYGCPCNFNALPSRGFCEGGWTWHVDEGDFDGVRLDDLNFSVYVKWPGAIHHGDGEAVVLVDERADDAQRQAVETLVGGDVGGPWGVLAWTWPTVHGPVLASYDVALDGIRSRLRIGEIVELELEPIANPVTGAEVTPGAVLPQGIIVKHADLARSKVFRIADAIALDHSGQYTAIGAFDYSG